MYFGSFYGPHDPFRAVSYHSLLDAEGQKGGAGMSQDTEHKTTELALLTKG